MSIDAKPLRASPMTATTDFIAELIRAANEVAPLTPFERRRLVACRGDYRCPAGAAGTQGQGGPAVPRRRLRP